MKKISNSEKLTAGALGLIPISQAIDEVMNDYSVRVGTAIGVVSSQTAPFIINILRDYANRIESDYPGSEKIQSDIDAIKSDIFYTLQVPTER